MAFNSQLHEIDTVTGFQVDKDTKLPTGLVGRPPNAPRRIETVVIVDPTVADAEWPKWVPVHESRIAKKSVDGAPDYVSVPGYENFHVDRLDGSVTVLVADEDAAREAASERSHEPASEAEEYHDEGVFVGEDDNKTLTPVAQPEAINPIGANSFKGNRQ